MTHVLENDFSSLCSLRKVFFIRESDWEGNQSYSNFLEVCKLAGVLTTINKPTTGLLSLPNMDNYTATRASGAPPPDFNSNLTLFLPHNSAFNSCTFPDRAVSVKVNLRPFLWQLFLAKAALLLSSDQIAFCPLTTQLQLLRLQSPNRNVSFLLHKNRQHATESRRKIIDISKQNVFTRSLIPGCNGNAFNGW